MQNTEEDCIFLWNTLRAHPALAAVPFGGRFPLEILLEYGKASLSVVKEIHDIYPDAIRTSAGDINTSSSTCGRAPPLLLHQAIQSRSRHDVIEFLISKNPEVVRAVGEHEKNNNYRAAIRLVARRYPEGITQCNHTGSIPLWNVLQYSGFPTAALDELLQALPPTCAI
ncbi:hypothetical protein SEMRO_1690_G291340.1 [Seminavis robusta]|uniref:Ankyrin repeat protein n=1 Tax=Seminavis robusta TaxID=568900 RepID=A0A9N8EVK0_9STRA|nr:hypothetical protein SEMRO_1690_G291340.1 [Seminavis robusta]|eukprot:Sro1690_g291340.1 n/a (169) ;mRNA; f:8320-8882